MAHCRKVREQFTIRLPYEGDYYVLYLYDEVGNLVATVPPEGVRLLEANQVAQVQAAREHFTQYGTFQGGPPPIYPAHTKVSHYRYNSANLQVWQSTPDAGVVQTFYDYALRPAASQDARQADSSLYSYLRYDYKGRLVESGVGRKQTATPPTIQELSHPSHPQNWLTQPRERVRVVYERPLAQLPPGWIQRNLRGRISYQERDEDGNGQPEQRYAYDYDALGNVRSLYIYTEALRGYNGSSGWKRVEYVYDRISGKVDTVIYQRGEVDQWIHANRYDGLRRLVEVSTSRSGWPTSWRREAFYRYYLHRPLARIELGHWPVQGLDYIFTLNGWIKGLNSYRLSDTLDAGRDGYPALHNRHRWMPRDVLAYEVLYYPGDYRPIGGYQGMSNFRDFAGLYNGNIGMSYIHQDTLSLLARQYRYDALQRLRQVRVREGIDLTPIPGYQEHFTYDKDGNITSVLRYAQDGVMDSLRYHYYSNLRNWLSHVTDTVRASAYQDDLDSQPAGNYRYDPVGNLIEDVSEGLRIRWTHYGKVSRIDSADTVKLRFQYDALGNRIVKEYVPARRREVYVRDAQGNVLALYEVRGDSLFTKEFYMYGHKRLGYLVDERYLGRFCRRRPCLWRDSIFRISDLLPGLGRPSAGTVREELEPTLPDFPARWGRAWVVGDVAELRLGARRYELSDWLGNVRVEVTDRRIPIRGNNQVVVGYRADVVSVTDYYSFGAEISMRSYEAQPWYRYGYQAQEKDHEIYGKGAMYHYTYRQHDARLGRFWSVDPLARKYPWNSPYAFGGNRVVDAVELEGLEYVVVRHYPGGRTEKVLYYTMTNKQVRALGGSRGTYSMQRLTGRRGKECCIFTMMSKVE